MPAASVPLAILGILLAAFVVNKLARRLVKLLVRRLGQRRISRGPGVLKRHTPAALLDTGELVSTRSSQRIEALAAALAGATTFVVWLVAALAVLQAMAHQPPAARADQGRAGPRGDRGPAAGALDGQRRDHRADPTVRAALMATGARSGPAAEPSPPPP